MKISISKEEEITRTVSITGKPEVVNRVLTLLAMIEYNGAVGHSGNFSIAFDGDGSDKIKLEGVDDVRKQNKDGFNACSGYGGMVEIVGENGKFFVTTKDRDVELKKIYPKD